MTLKRQGLVDLKQWEECRASAQLPSCSHVFFPTPKAVKSQTGVETQNSQNSHQVSPAFWLDYILQTASPVALFCSPSAGLWREAQLAWGTGAHRGSVPPVSLGVLSWWCWGSQAPAPTRVIRQARGCHLWVAADSEHGTHVDSSALYCTPPMGFGAPSPVSSCLKWGF